jgi:hypothetical protein
MVVLTAKVKRWKRLLAKLCHAPLTVNGMNGRNGDNATQNVALVSKPKSVASRSKLPMAESHVKVLPWKHKIARTSHALLIARFLIGRQLDLALSLVEVV